MSLAIAHISATFPPYPGGTGVVCANAARALARRGHRVTVLTAAQPGAPAEERWEGVTVRRLRPVVRAGNAPLLPLTPGLLRPFDQLHLHCPFISGAELTALAAAANGTPLAITYHNDLVRGGGWRDALFQLAGWSLRRLVLPQARRVLFVSRGHAESCDLRDLAASNSERCRVVPNGVDTGLFRPAPDRMETRHALGLPAGRPLVGFVGGLDLAHHYKGLEVLLEALANPNLGAVGLLVVGDGELRARYVALSERLGLAGRTLFVGAADHKRLPALYRACDMVAMPSLAPESFGLVVAEALACGVPVVASDSPGVRELLRPRVDGLLVPPGKAEALAAGLAELLALPQPWLGAMGATGAERIGGVYSWDRVAAELERAYAGGPPAGAWEVAP